MSFLLFFACENPIKKKTFIDVDTIINVFSDSLSFDVNKYMIVLEENYSDQFIIDTILNRNRNFYDETYLIDLFNENNLRTNYFDTSSARQAEITFFVFNTLFNESYLQHPPKNTSFLNKLKEIKTTYYPNIYAGNQISRPVTIALIDDLFQEGFLTNRELKLLLVVRFFLMEVSLSPASARIANRSVGSRLYLGPYYCY